MHGRYLVAGNNGVKKTQHITREEIVTALSQKLRRLSKGDYKL